MTRLIILFFFILHICSCSTTKKTVVDAQEFQDMNKDVFQYWFSQTTSFVLDTIYFNLPRVELERTSEDSVSHLENEYAYSDARINKNGTLFHNLIMLPQNIPKVIEKPVTEIKEKTNNIKQRTVTITKTRTVTKKVIPTNLRIWATIGKLLIVLLSIYAIIKYIKSIFKKRR